MELKDQFIEYILTENLFQIKDRLLIAVSGGVDSVVLCDLCRQAGYDFTIAHCNFQLRGEESDADEGFVKQLAAQYQVEFFVQKFDTKRYAAEHKLSIQVAARELRYNWFKELMNESTDQPVSHVLTAHHANDNIETLLMNFFKGTGMAGLQGIRSKSGDHHQLVRPLLFAKKEALLQYAQEHALAYREDSSNSSDKYTRNYFRNRLIPALEEVYPQVTDNLLDNIRRFKDIDILYRQSLNAQKKKLMLQKGNEWHLPVLKLSKAAALHTLVYEISRDFGFAATQVNDIVKLLESESGKYVLSATHRILRNRNWLIISKPGTSEGLNFLIEETDDKINFNDHKIVVEKSSQPLQIDPDKAIALLDAADIKFPLLLRKWKQGDYFYPLGMKKKKKLSRFFIDQKLSLLEKENSWVIEMNKKIIWVVGQRIDDRFKITANTTATIKLIVSMA